MAIVRMSPGRYNGFVKKSLTKGVLGLLAVILFAALGSVCVRVAKPRGPVLLGKSVDAWLEEIPWGTNQAGVELAFQRLGPAAVPRLITIMDDTEDRLDNFSYSIQRRINPHALSDFQRHWAAAEACRAMGTNAAAALPSLTRLLKRHDATEEIARDMLNVSPAAASILTNELSDPNPKVRETVASVLKWSRLSPETAVAGLIFATRDKVPAVRAEACWSLGCLRACTEQSVPALIKALDDPALDVRGQAAAGLELYGTNAISAVPALIESMRTHPRDNVSSVVNALRKIDPSVLTTDSLNRPFP